MSRNSKNAQRNADAKAVSANRKNGNRGPARTVKKTAKKATWFNLLKMKNGAAVLAAAQERLAADKAAQAAS